MTYIIYEITTKLYKVAIKLLYDRNSRTCKCGASSPLIIPIVTCIPGR